MILTECSNRIWVVGQMEKGGWTWMSSSSIPPSSFSHSAARNTHLAFHSEGSSSCRSFSVSASMSLRAVFMLSCVCVVLCVACQREEVWRPQAELQWWMVKVCVFVLRWWDKDRLNVELVETERQLFFTSRDLNSNDIFHQIVPCFGLELTLCGQYDWHLMFHLKKVCIRT